MFLVNKNKMPWLCERLIFDKYQDITWKLKEIIQLIIKQTNEAMYLVSIAEGCFINIQQMITNISSQFDDFDTLKFIKQLTTRTLEKINPVEKREKKPYHIMSSFIELFHFEKYQINQTVYLLFYNNKLKLKKINENKIFINKSCEVTNEWYLNDYIFTELNNNEEIKYNAYDLIERYRHKTAEILITPIYNIINNKKIFVKYNNKNCYYEGQRMYYEKDKKIIKISEVLRCNFMNFDTGDMKNNDDDTKNEEFVYIYRKTGAVNKLCVEQFVLHHQLKPIESLHYKQIVEMFKNFDRKNWKNDNWALKHVSTPWLKNMYQIIKYFIWCFQESGLKPRRSVIVYLINPVDPKIYGFPNKVCENAINLYFYVQNQKKKKSVLNRKINLKKKTKK